MTPCEKADQKTPPGFERLPDLSISREFYSLAFRTVDGGLTVIVSEENHDDGFTYLHVSFSRRSRLPTYEDLDRVRKAFIGEDRESVQVFPKREEYVNLHPNTLHLWHCYEREIFPSPRRGK